MESSEDLLPGDLVSLTRSPPVAAQANPPNADEYTVPCDVILLNGSVVVDEAMLSGESTPVLKEAISLDSTLQGNSKLSLYNDLHRRFLVFGGTKVLQSMASTDAYSTIPAAPDHGAIAYVIRTGFATTQGHLVQQMLFSTKRHASANSMDSFLFILFLLAFAVVAAYHVYVEGTKGGRPPKRLLLDCIIILTSVVPPELPMGFKNLFLKLNNI